MTLGSPGYAVQCGMADICDNKLQSSASIHAKHRYQCLSVQLAMAKLDLDEKNNEKAVIADIVTDSEDMKTGGIECNEDMNRTSE
jgi:hypothetical protein